MITEEEAKRAKLFVQLNFAFQIALIFLHLCGVGSLILNAFDEASRPRHHASTPAEYSEFVGRMITYGVCAIWVFAGLALLPVNVVGLHQKKRWALTSTRIYWAASLITCCCTPFGIFGLWSLSRPGVAEELNR